MVLLEQKKVQQVILLPDKYYVLIFRSTYAYKGALEQIVVVYWKVIKTLKPWTSENGAKRMESKLLMPFCVEWLITPRT